MRERGREIEKNIIIDCEQMQFENKREGEINAKDTREGVDACGRE